MDLRGRGLVDTRRVGVGREGEKNIKIKKKNKGMPHKQPAHFEKEMQHVLIFLCILTV